MGTTKTDRASRPQRTSAPTAAGRLDRAAIKNLVVEKLAVVDATEPAAIRTAMAECSGDLPVDSQQAVTVIAMVGQQLGCMLPGPEDLDPEEYTSIDSLTSLIERKLQGARPSL